MKGLKNSRASQAHIQTFILKIKVNVKILFLTKVKDVNV